MDGVVFLARGILCTARFQIAINVPVIIILLPGKDKIDLEVTSLSTRKKTRPTNNI